MTDRVMADALYEEERLRPSRPYFTESCDKLGLTRRKRAGPAPMPPDQKRANNTSRWRNWVAGFKERDPEGYESWLERRKKKRRKTVA